MRHLARHVRMRLLLAIMLALALNGVPVTAQPTGAPTSKAPAPNSDIEAGFRKKVRELYAEDLKLAKTPAQINGLATKLAEAANDPKNDINSVFALSIEATNLYASMGDLLSAFRLVDELAKRVEINPISRKLELLKTLGKEKLTTPQKKSLAIVGLKLSSDAFGFEEYAAAQEAATFAVESAKPSADKTILDRAIAQAQRCTDMNKTWREVRDARVKLMANDIDAIANETVGRYLCFIRQDWKEGLPRLAKGASAELKSIAEKDLVTSQEASAMAATAEAWWELSESRKEKEKREILPRSAYWYELALPNLTGLDKVTAEKRLEAAYEVMSGRAFKKLLTGSANGMRVPGELDCQLKVHVSKMGSGFDFKKSWLTSFEMAPSNLEAGFHLVFIWGDSRPGQDALYFQMQGPTMYCAITDCYINRGQAIPMTFTENQIGKWTNVKFVHDAVSQELELYINYRLVSKETLTIGPKIDRKMNAAIGGTDDGKSQRFTGKVRDLWIGNIK